MNPSIQVIDDEESMEKRQVSVDTPADNTIKPSTSVSDGVNINEVQIVVNAGYLDNDS